MSTTSTNLRVVVRRLGGPEGIELREETIPRPAPGEVRIAVEAAGVSQADITIREGMYPERAPLPFGLGYDLVGRVDAVGAGVTSVREGDRVGALVVRGAWARYVCWRNDDLIAVPSDLDAATAVALLLNYITAYQLLHRAAEAADGERVLVTSAAGGVGTAVLQLAREARVTAYGVAAPHKASIVRAEGGQPIDGSRADWDRVVREATDGGVDIALDGIGGANLTRSYRSLRASDRKRGRRSRFVGFGFTSKMGSPWLGRLETFARLGWHAATPDGRTARFYGIMFAKRAQPAQFAADVEALFTLARRGAIVPRIDGRLPLHEAKEAMRRIEAREVTGKLVLIPEAS